MQTKPRTSIELDKISTVSVYLECDALVSRDLAFGFIVYFVYAHLYDGRRI